MKWSKRNISQIKTINGRIDLLFFIQKFALKIEWCTSWIVIDLDNNSEINGKRNTWVLIHTHTHFLSLSLSLNLLRYEHAYILRLTDAVTCKEVCTFLVRVREAHMTSDSWSTLSICLQLVHCTDTRTHAHTNHTSDFALTTNTGAKHLNCAKKAAVATAAVAVARLMRREKKRKSETDVAVI